MKLSRLDDHRVRQLLGRELQELVDAVGVQLEQIVSITGLPSPVRAAETFRLHFCNGLILKGRRLASPGQAERLHEIGRLLAGKGLVQVFARNGAAVLERWILGTPLNVAQPGADTVTQCGEMLGSIHGAAVPALLAEAYSPGQAVIEKRRARLERQVDELIQGAVLSHPRGSQLIAAAEAAAPGSATIGYFHGDFCPPNIVQDPTGQLHCVDNATVSLDAQDLDLARTVYRWTMNTSERTAFFGGYVRHRTADSFWAHFDFWMISVLVDSTLKRHLAGSSCVAVPLKRLQELLCDAHNRVGHF